MKIIKIQDLLNIKEYRTRTRMKLLDLVGKVIVITGFTAKQSQKYDKAGYKIQFHSNGKNAELFTCATAVVELLNALKLKLAELGNSDSIGIACIILKNGESFYLEEYSKNEENKGDTNVSTGIYET